MAASVFQQIQRELEKVLDRAPFICYTRGMEVNRLSRTDDLGAFTAFIEEGGKELSPEEFLESLPSGGLDYAELGQEIAKLLAGHFFGKIKLPKDRLNVGKFLGQKMIPDAPKRIELEARVVPPEEYIAEAMGKNRDSLRVIEAAAADYTVLEEEKNLALAEYQAMEGEIPSEEGEGDG